MYMDIRVCVMSVGCCMMVVFVIVLFVFFKQKTAYEMRISDWSSDVCSSDLGHRIDLLAEPAPGLGVGLARQEALAAELGIDLVPELQIGRASCRERVCQYV